MLNIIIPNDKPKIQSQIKALQGLLLNDNAKDKEIHIQAINKLKMALG